MIKHMHDVAGVSLDIEDYCTLRPFFVLPGRGKVDRSCLQSAFSKERTFVITTPHLIRI